MLADPLTKAMDTERLDKAMMTGYMDLRPTAESLMINGAELLNPELDPKNGRFEVDSVALDFETATVFVVESKKTISNDAAKKVTMPTPYHTQGLQKGAWPASL